MPASLGSGIHSLGPFLGRKSGRRCLATPLFVPWQVDSNQMSPERLLPTASCAGLLTWCALHVRSWWLLRVPDTPLAPLQPFLLDQEDI
jgi:hypothetical protein